MTNGLRLLLLDLIIFNPKATLNTNFGAISEANHKQWGLFMTKIFSLGLLLVNLPAFGDVGYIGIDNKAAFLIATNC